MLAGMTARFLRSLPPDGSARDQHIVSAIRTGHLDTPTWVRLKMGRVEIEVSADYLTIFGEHVPMAAAVAQVAVESLDALLPTPGIVGAIEAQAVIIPAPTWSPEPGQSRMAQTSSAVFGWCEEETQRRMAKAGVQPGQLVAGHRKDVVIAGFMLDGQVSIFGARWPDGRRIQNLFPRPGNAPGHEDGWEDYIQGIRAVRRRCWLDGVETTVDAILSGPDAALLGGPVAKLRYPTTGFNLPPLTPRNDVPVVTAPAAAAAPPAPPATRPTLRYGARGDDVKELQRLLIGRGFVIARDGIFGPATNAAVREFQGEQGLTVDSIVGPKTWAALLSGAAPRPDADPYRELPAGPFPSDSVMDEPTLWAKYGKIEWVAAPHPLEKRMVRVTNGWNKDHLTTVVVPQLIGIKGVPAGGRILCHKLFAPKLVAAFADVEREGKLKYILTWDGLLNQRTMTGQPDKLSRHAYGLGFDINATWNPFKGPASRGYGTVLPLVQIFRRHRIGWLGDHDPMHFEDLG